MLFFVTPKFCISIDFSFPWELKWPKEKLKTMLMQNFGVRNKEHYRVLWYFREWSIKYVKEKKLLYYHVCINEIKHMLNK